MRELITAQIRSTLKGNWPKPYDINCGLCEDFAQEVIHSLTGTGETPDLHMIWIEDLTHGKYKDFAHAVIRLNTPEGHLYFDAECPEGVYDLDDLPVVCGCI